MFVKICGLPYRLNRVVDPLHVDHDRDGASLWGQISYSRQSINFLASTPERELRTVLHEVIHGLIQEGAITALMDANGRHDEATIDQLANGLAGVLESLGMRLPQEQ